MSARRQFLRTGVAAGAGAALHAFAPARAWAASSTVLPSTTGAAAITELVIAKRELSIAGRRALPTVVNGLLPGPILRFREGETVTIRVKNELQEDRKSVV